jgi:hypothetical protein
MQFTLKIKLGNDAMKTRFDIANALNRVALNVVGAVDTAKIYDANGNAVGEWKLSK